MAIGDRVELVDLARAAKRPQSKPRQEPEKDYPPRKFVGLEKVANKQDDTPWQMAENIVFPFGPFSGDKKKQDLQGYAKYESMFMGNPYLASCVRIISGCVMAGGWRITPKVKGGKIHPQNEALAHKFFENVHPDFSFNELMRGDMEPCTLSGRLFQEIGLNALKQPAALYSLPQASIWQTPGPDGLLPDPPKTAYKQFVKDEDKPREVAKNRVLWLRQDGMRINSLNPVSPAELVMVAHTNIDQSQRYFKSFFTSGGKMGIVIKNPKWDKAQAIEARRYYEKMFTDSDNGHQMLIVYDGSEFEEPPKQYSNWAQLIDVQKLDARKVCGVFGVDPRLVGFATEGNSLGGEGERERAMQELYVTRINPIKELLGEQITKQILVNGLRILDAKFEFVLFQDKMDVNGKLMLAQALEIMERLGAINTAYLPDLNHLRYEFDEGLDPITEDQIEEGGWPAPVQRANAKVSELQAFVEGARAGVVGADKLEDANLIRSVISPKLEELDQAGLEEFRKKALISQGMATAPSMFAAPIQEPTSDSQEPDDEDQVRFDPSQPRDDNGQWTDGGGGGSSGALSGSAGGSSDSGSGSVGGTTKQRFRDSAKVLLNKALSSLDAVDAAYDEAASASSQYFESSRKLNKLASKLEDEEGITSSGETPQYTRDYISDLEKAIAAHSAGQDVDISQFKDSADESDADTISEMHKSLERERAILSRYEARLGKIQSAIDAERVIHSESQSGLKNSLKKLSMAIEAYSSVSSEADEASESGNVSPPDRFRLAADDLEWSDNWAEMKIGDVLKKSDIAKERNAVKKHQAKIDAQTAKVAAKKAAKDTSPLGESARALSPVEAYADKWSEKASAALLSSVTECAQKTAERLVAAYENGSTVKQRLSAFKKVPKSLVNGSRPMAAFRRELKAYYKTSYELASKEVGKEAKSARAEDAILDEAASSDIEDYIELFGESEFDDLYNTLVQRQRAVFLEAIRTGWNTKTLVKQLESVTQDYTTREITTIVRTAATDFFNQARLAAGNESDAVTHFVFRAVGDNRTSKICKTLNGIQIAKHRTDILNQVCPACHPACRSSLSPGFGPFETDEERLAAGIALIPAGYGGTVAERSAYPAAGSNGVFRGYPNEFKPEYDDDDES